MTKSGLTEKEARKVAQKLLIRYGSVESIRRNSRILSIPYGPEGFAIIIEAAEKLKNNRVPQTTLKEHRSSGGWNSATAPKLFYQDTQINPFWPVPKIVDYLLKKYRNPEGIKRNESLLLKCYGKLRYGHILKELDERAYRDSRTVVTNNSVDDTLTLGPIETVLKIERRCHHNGIPCFVVKYSPDGGEPYDWYVPVVRGLPDDVEYIRCRYVSHSLYIPDTWVIRKQYPQGTKHSFVVAGKRKTKESFRYLLRDDYGMVFEILDFVDMPIGSLAHCLVTGHNMNSNPYHHLKLRVVEYTEKPVSVKKEPRTKRTSDSDKQTGANAFRKTPQQWFREVDGFGKHIYGNSGVCSCCGGEFGPRKGWRVEFKNIYFCQSCKNKVYEPTGRGWLNIIYTPMGNKK